MILQHLKRKLGIEETMKIYSQNKYYKLYNGNMLDMKEVIEPESIDSIVTDPPYGLTSIVKRFGSDDAKPAGEAKDGSFARLSKGFMGRPGTVQVLSITSKHGAAVMKY